MYAVATTVVGSNNLRPDVHAPLQRPDALQRLACLHSRPIGLEVATMLCRPAADEAPGGSGPDLPGQNLAGQHANSWAWCYPRREAGSRLGVPGSMPTLILGLLALVGSAPPQEPDAIQAPLRPRIIAEQPFEMRPLNWPPLGSRSSVLQLRLPNAVKLNPLWDTASRSTQDSPDSAMVCTMRVLIANPSIDRAFVRPAARDVDPGIIGANGCGDP